MQITILFVYLVLQSKLYMACYIKLTVHYWQQFYNIQHFLKVSYFLNLLYISKQYLINITLQ